MGIEYRAVQWSRQKRLYDFALAGGVGLFLVIFAVLSKFLFPLITDEILLIRTFGAAAFVLLHVILCIGPLCRMHPKFLPLLYNRRHAGVTMCSARVDSCDAGHFHLSRRRRYESVSGNFYFKLHRRTVCGNSISTLRILCAGYHFVDGGNEPRLLAGKSERADLEITAHARLWRYGLLVLHVTFGVLQSEVSPIYTALVGIGFITVLGLHVTAGMKEISKDREMIRSTRREVAHSENKTSQSLVSSSHTDDEFVEVCAVDEIQENRAASLVSLANASQFSNTTEKFPLFQMSASIRTVLLAKEKFSTAALPVLGTVINTCRKQAHHLRRLWKKFRPSMSA